MQGRCCILEKSRRQYSYQDPLKILYFFNPSAQFWNVSKSALLVHLLTSVSSDIENLYSMKIKGQTRELAAGCSKHRFEVVDRTDEVSSKHCFEVVDKTDEVSHIYTARRRWRGLKRFSKSITIRYPREMYCIMRRLIR